MACIVTSKFVGIYYLYLYLYNINDWFDLYKEGQQKFVVFWGKVGGIETKALSPFLSERDSGGFFHL